MHGPEEGEGSSRRLGWARLFDMSDRFSAATASRVTEQPPPDEACLVLRLRDATPIKPTDSKFFGRKAGHFVSSPVPFGHPHGRASAV
eukprot:9496422-Pyramimonas_sp.AAC.1